jgi:catechol 2,3-dioxygenase-like lactoylglutathione lyase family enzyme
MWKEDSPAGDFDDLDAEMLRLERELENELADMPGSDRESWQRAPHLAYMVLYTSDVEELAAFYTGVFGFGRRYEGGTTVELVAGAVTLALTDESHLLDVVGIDRLPRPFEGRASHTILVEDVDDCYRAAIEMGAQAIRAPHDTDWGMRSCWLRDPAGHLLEIGRFVR